MQEDSKLHIVETADDDENTSLEEGVEAGNLREQSGQTPAHEAAVAASATTPSNKVIHHEELLLSQSEIE
ncbi:unnamed protein product [Anisakis simplex]|uniref:Uncharacterized protein n=1 Tax=Anisakis simplex TaxID=6269 RepID=A0A0M3JCU7_ANISI|nr:unnamed protein product [Anisakis simplex]